MLLRTELPHIPIKKLIAPNDGLLLVGSCFTDHIGEWLQQMWLPVCSNPWGVLFNPASIAQSIHRLQVCLLEDFPLVERAGRYYSFAHHGRFAGTDAQQLQSQLQGIEKRAREAYDCANHILVTLGTSWVYERSGEVVANCHKFPASEFVRRMLSVDEIVALWQPIIAAAHEKHFIFTVSPIRHIGDGLHGNQLSKATLLLAIEKLQKMYPEQVDYLPVYELFMDDLRDYRFYAEDLVHPGNLGVEMVKEFVSDCCFTKELKDFVSEALPIVKALAHRPSDPDSEQHMNFVMQQETKRQQLLKKYKMN